MNGSSAVEFFGNRRIHIGLAVTDLARSTQFYRTLFGVEPTKERPGYAKFEPVDPSVNLSLSEVAPGSKVAKLPTHFGIQVKSTQAVQEAIERFHAAGLETRVEEQTTCCYAVQNKAWVTDPDGNQWEVFVVLDADSEQMIDADSTCCTTGPAETAAQTSCCTG